MSNKRYNGGGPTVQGIWACIAGALVGAPVFIFLLIAHTIGDCMPDEDCKPSTLIYVVLPSLVAGFVAALTTWWAVRAIRGNGS